MRLSLTFAALFLSVLLFSATALPCSTHCDRDSVGSRGKAATEWNNVVTSRVGDTTVWSNGYTSKNVGNHRSIFSDGSMATRLGNMSVFDNGRTFTHYGNSVVCEEPRASSRQGRGW